MLTAMGIAFAIGFLVGFALMFVKYQGLKEQVADMSAMLKTPVGDLVAKKKKR